MNNSEAMYKRDRQKILQNGKECLESRFDNTQKPVIAYLSYAEFH